MKEKAFTSINLVLFSVFLATGFSISIMFMVGLKESEHASAIPTLMLTEVSPTPSKQSNTRILFLGVDDIGKKEATVLSAWAFIQGDTNNTFLACPIYPTASSNKNISIKVDPRDTMAISNLEILAPYNNSPWDIIAVLDIKGFAHLLAIIEKRNDEEGVEDYLQKILLMATVQTNPSDAIYEQEGYLRSFRGILPNANQESESSLSTIIEIMFNVSKDDFFITISKNELIEKAQSLEKTGVILEFKTDEP